MIILRGAHTKLGTDTNLLDVNGGLSVEYRAASHATNLWPLKKTGGAHGDSLTVTKVESSQRVLSIRRIMQAAVPVKNTGQNAVIPVSVISVNLTRAMRTVVPPVMVTVLSKCSTKKLTMMTIKHRLLPLARLCMRVVTAYRSGLSCTIVR